MEGILTAVGQLLRASEYRFNYWRTEHEHRYYLVKCGVLLNDGRWCITDGNGFSTYWNGRDWDNNLRGPDAYRFEVEEALVIAQSLAFEENQRMIAVMENRFPGGHRGRTHDMAKARETG